MFTLMLMMMWELGAMNVKGGSEFKYEFSQLQTDHFIIVNDGVMGGRSGSELLVHENKAQFKGSVSLENNGGFASVRMLWPYVINNEELEPQLMALKIKGDGKIYQFRLRTNKGFDGAAYSYSFQTTKGLNQTVHISVEDFIPTFRGRTLSDMPQLKFSEVQQMGVLIADSQVGQFSIDLINLSLD